MLVAHLICLGAAERPQQTSEAAEPVYEAEALEKIGVLPKPKKMSPPEYPYDLLRDEISGAVEISCVVDKAGKVTEAQVIESTDRGFEVPALESLKRSLFVPGRIEGQPVKTRLVRVIEFNTTRPKVDTWRAAQAGGSSPLPPEFHWDKPPIASMLMRPVYPFEELLAKESGQVQIECVVGPDGRVVGVKMIEATKPAFGQAVLAMLEARTLTPGQKKSGHKTYAYMRAIYQFEPTGKGNVPVSMEALKIERMVQKKPQAIIAEKELDQALQSLSCPRAVYPGALAKSATAGAAEIEYFVDTTGYAQLPRIVASSAPEFGYAAVHAVARWRFKPPLKDGKPVIVRVRQTIPFTPPL